MKVCHLTSVHKRYDTRIFIKECRSLSKRGYQTNLIVADGEGDEIKDNVYIWDVGKPMNRFFRILQSTKGIYLKAKDLDADVYHFHDPELVFTGLKLKKAGKKVIFDIHEDVEEQIKIRPWIPKLVRNIIAKVYAILESKWVEKFDYLIVPQQFMVPKYGKLNKNTCVIENFAFIDLSEETMEKWKAKNENFNIFHAGSLTVERGLFNMIDLVKRTPPEINLTLAGNVNDRHLPVLKDTSNKYNFEYLGLLNKSELDSKYKNSHCGIILYENKGQYHRSYSVKLFEYMVNAMPVIMPDFGDWISFNKETQCGLNVNPNNPEEVLEAVLFLWKNQDEAKKMGGNGRSAVLEKFNWGVAEEKLVKIYSIICTAT